MNLSRRALLSSIGFGVMSACAGAQTPPAAKPVEAPEELGARKQRLAAPNPMGVTQASFRRAFEAGMKPDVANASGWTPLTAAAAIPAFLLLARLAPWGEQEPRGSFDPERDAT